MKILILNAGSSSQKICLYDLPDATLPLDPPIPVWQAQIDWHDLTTQLQVKTDRGEIYQETYPSVSKSAGTLKALQTLWHSKTQVVNHPKEIDIVGHRVVHGGETYRQSTWINAAVKAEIDRLSIFAPLHNPVNLAGIESLKLITCHLGNGCSLAAIRDGYSIDTTMGFTPLDGMMMGTRSGSIDPGILIHLLRHSGGNVDELDRLLNHKSGLLGISGISNDMRQIVSTMERGNDRAKLAFDIFIHRLRSSIGAMLASLGGVDALVFTAGIGENSATVRQAACEGFEFLGLALDRELNQSHPIDLDIAHADAAIRVLVIHTQEDWAIARECHRLASISY